MLCLLILIFGNYRYIGIEIPQKRNQSDKIYSTYNYLFMPFQTGINNVYEERKKSRLNINRQIQFETRTNLKFRLKQETAESAKRLKSVRISLLF